MKQFTFICISAVVLIFLYSCATKKESTNKNQTIKVVKGNDFSIDLPANPSTGYSWCFAEKPDTTILSFSKKEFKPKQNDSVISMIGAGGTEKWIFKSHKKGKTEMKLKYARPWEKDTAAEYRTFKIKVK